MNMSVLQLVVAAVGLMIGAVCILGFVAPGRLTGIAREFWMRGSSQFIAVVMRLILGILLIAVAPVSRFPMVLKVVGGLSVMAAIGIVAGLVVGALGPVALIAAVGDLLPVEARIGVYPAPLAVAAGFGALSALTFSLWPLGRACEVTPGSLFRS